MSDWLLVFATAATIEIGIPALLAFSAGGRARLAAFTAGINKWWEWPVIAAIYFGLCCVAAMFLLGFLGFFGPIPIDEAYRR